MVDRLYTRPCGRLLSTHVTDVSLRQGLLFFLSHPLDVFFDGWGGSQRVDWAGEGCIFDHLRLCEGPCLGGRQVSAGHRGGRALYWTMFVELGRLDGVVSAFVDSAEQSVVKGGPPRRAEPTGLVGA